MMNTQSIDKILAQEAVAQFLTAADNVLNSNTFLLYLPFVNSTMKPTQWQEKLVKYINSKQFDADVLQNDHLREWDNYTTIDTEALDKGEVVYLIQDLYFKRKNPVRITPFLAQEKTTRKEDYLAAMLNDQRVTQIPETGIAFYSPYRKGLSNAQAIEIIQGFTECLFGQSNWQLWTISPDFMYSRHDFEELDKALQKDDFRNDYITYFEGSAWIANDAVSLLLGEKESFLLLTNGVH